MAFEWTELTYLERTGRSQASLVLNGYAWSDWLKELDQHGLIFVGAVVFVFLVLAAQYESWSLPLAVILVVPMCMLGSLTGVAHRQQDINIFTQIGFVVLVGLASKNAILIVEFAKHAARRRRRRAARRRWKPASCACRPI